MTQGQATADASRRPAFLAEGPWVAGEGKVKESYSQEEKKTWAR